LKSIKNRTTKYWRRWTIFVILAMVIYVGLLIFQYVYKPIYKPEETTIQRLEINKNVYNEIIRTYSESQENINRIINKDYPDIFK
jgi:uncharacterized protein YpmS